MSTEEITALVAVSGIVGVLLNPLISFLKRIFGLEEGEQTEAKRRVKFVLSVITSIGGGVLVAILSGFSFDGNLTNILISTGLVFTAASVVYNLYWKDSTPEAKIEGK